MLLIIEDMEEEVESMDWTEVKSRKRQKSRESDVASDSDSFESTKNFKANKKQCQQGKINVPAKSQCKIPSNKQLSSNSKSHLKLNESMTKVIKPIFVSASFEVVKNLCIPLKLKAKPTFKVKGSKATQITCENLLDKKVIMDALKIKQIHYHTFSEPSEKPSNFVLKGFFNTESETLLEALNLSDVPASKVKKIFNNEHHPMYLVSFPSSLNMNCKILNYNHRLVDHISVKWEPFKNRNKKPIQCFNCQRWGHSSSNCGYPYRCVKCDEPHGVGECKRKNKEEGSPKCVNCKKDHAANYKNCEEAIKFAKRLPKNPSPIVPPKVSINLDNQNQFPRLFEVEPNNIVENQLPATSGSEFYKKSVSLTRESTQSGIPLARRLQDAQNRFVQIPGIEETIERFVKLVDDLSNCHDEKLRISILINCCFEIPSHGS